MNFHHLGSMDHCLRHLVTAISTAKLYSTNHQQVKKLCQMSHASLLEAMETQNAISLKRVDEQLAVNEHPMNRTMYIERFARILKKKGIGHIKFLQNVSTSELNRLISDLAGAEKVIKSSDNIRLGQVEVRHRPIVKSSMEKSSLNSDLLPDDSDATSMVFDQEEKKLTAGKNLNGLKNNELIESAQILENISTEELTRIMEVYEEVKNNRSLHVVGLSEIVSGFIEVFSNFADPLLTLVPLRNMDEYTFTHSLNVCMLNLAQATALGLEGQLLHDIGLSAMLHDIGKLFIPEEVLNKPEKLDRKEWEMMELHPIRGAEYLLDTPGVPRMAVVNAYEHHMRFDLRGYPKVNRDWRQNLCSQLTSISDTYDSLRTRRPYRKPLDLDIAINSIEKMKGTQLHPLLVENFLQVIQKVTSH